MDSRRGVGAAVSVTAPGGFRAGGVACGIKEPAAPDLALVATGDGQPVTAAAVFTSNLAPAAPVDVSRAHLRASGGRATAVVLNSGNANAATGARGRADAERTCELAAGRLGCGPDAVLVCSTGLIGIPLPLTAVEAGMPPLVEGLAADGGPAAARAIMTTDTHPKEVVVEGDGFTVGGMAKGAAMLAPDMATMLAVLTTDASIDPRELQVALRGAVEVSFNALSVDGCTSTNDTVIVLAGATAGPASAATMLAPLTAACTHLALQMAGDAEGATKVVTVRVGGAASDEEARRAARKVAESQLVKCSLYGGDPYWGRVVSELGTAGVVFDPRRVSIAYNGIEVCRAGVAADHDGERLVKQMAARTIELHCHLGIGTGEGVILTNDLSHAYIDENMRTS